MIELTAEEVERGYNNRAAVPEHPQWFAKYAQWSAATSAALGPKLDLRYGAGPKETLDLFLPKSPARGTLVFLHGGYWRALDKSDFSFVAEPFVAQGYAYANVNYDLCPSVSVATIVEQTRRAVAWLVREGPAHGANAQRLVVAGHSAGGHLAAMLHATDWHAHGLATNPITGALSLSGLHDLTPMVLSTLNADLKLDVAEARRLSPLHLAPTTNAPIVAACGADETSEFRRQTQMLWDMWPQHRPASMRGPMFVPARDHFSVVADYRDPESALTRLTLALL